MATKAPKHRHGTGHLKVPWLLILVAAVVVIIAAAVALSLANSVQNIGNGGNLTLGASGTAFVMGGNEYVAYAVPKSNDSAYVYIAMKPVLANPLLNVAISSGALTHVNYDSAYSNVGMQLEGVHNGSAEVHFVSIDTSLAIAPDSSSIRYVNAFSGNLSTPKATNLTKVHINTTSTIPVSSSITTTTIVQQNNYEKALAALEKDAFYSLMDNYSKLYANSVNCTPDLYNSTYSKYYGYPPAGQFTYQNMSVLVPYNMSLKLEDVSGALYSAVYTTKGKSAIATGTALTVYINSTSESIINSTLSGVFSGLNQSMLYSGYISAEHVGGACGIYVE